MTSSVVPPRTRPVISAMAGIRFGAVLPARVEVQPDAVIPAQAGIQFGAVIPAQVEVQPDAVIPAKAGIQCFRIDNAPGARLDPRLRGDDGASRRPGEVPQ